MRGILAIFAVAWLNLLIQPCAMALGTLEDHDCPHCPPSHAESQPDHSMHSGHMAGADTAAAEMPCATVATDCGEPDQLNFDGRSAKLQLNDPPNDTAVAVAPTTLPDAKLRPAAYPGWHGTRSPPPIESVPLNVIYCVYLK